MKRDRSAAEGRNPPPPGNAPPVKEHLKAAVAAARAAGAVISRDFGRPRIVNFKGRTNPVTETDLRAESAILSILRAQFPSHDILTEETEQKPSGSDYLWVVDPMDGTVNFTHRYPCVSVSLALRKDGDTILGVVLDPLRDELFVAEKGSGSTLNGARIAVSPINKLGDSLICTGFPYGIAEAQGDTFRIFESLSLLAQGVRRDGSAAIDLCYVAAGIFDGFWERGLKPWDTAAAVLILREAGGRATDYRGGEFDPFTSEIVASNGFIHEEMVGEIIKRGAS